MVHTTPESATSSYIPAIDIAPFLRDPDSVESQKTIDQVRAACQSTGFFQITGHGIPEDLQEEVFRAAKKFFALSFDEKKALDASKSMGHRGYDVLASQSFHEGILPDLKEGYYTGVDIQPDDPRCGRIFMGPNVWPPSSVLDPSDFQRPCEQYHAATRKLVTQVFSLVARTLPYKSSIFHHFPDNDAVATLRLLRYPPAVKTESKRQYGASAHTDFGAVTLLLQDQNPGLQVLDRDTGLWMDVPPKENAYVCNLGDIFGLWTRGYYVSSVHRVINTTPNDRYSVVLFLEGNLDCSLDPLDGSPGKGKTVEAHMLERMGKSYGE